jgi:DNA-binding LacI/PurR family transcriptional regulator
MSSTEKKTPKYQEIVGSLRRDVSMGRFKPGERIPSEAEITRRFKVSRMTAVKAIQQLQQEGLVLRRAGSGTFVAESAETRRSFGLLIPDLGQTEIFEPICRGMMRTPLGKEHLLLWGHAVWDDRNRELEAERLCRQFIEARVSGIFFAPLEFSEHHGNVNENILSAFKEADVPVVLLDRDVAAFPERSAYDLVCLDNRQAGFVITRHLIEQGCKRIAFFARKGSADTVETRIAGYTEALISAGLFQNGMIVRGDTTDGAFVAAEIVDKVADGIVCANDFTAANMMHTLQALGRKIPDDILLTGFDDVKYARLLPIPLTTIHQPCAEIGASAMAAMLERVENPNLPGRQIQLRGELVVRESSGIKEIE